MEFENLHEAKYDMVQLAYRPRAPKELKSSFLAQIAQYLLLTVRSLKWTFAGKMLFFPL